MAKFMGYSPGDWASFMLVVWVALVLLQMLFDGMRRVGGPTGRNLATSGERLAGLD